MIFTIFKRRIFTALFYPIGFIFLENDYHEPEGGTDGWLD